MVPELHIINMNSNFARLVEAFIEIWTNTAFISEPEALFGDKRIEDNVGRCLMGHIISSDSLNQNLVQHYKENQITKNCIALLFYCSLDLFE